MSLKIDSQKRNELLNREECWISLEHAGKPTPKRAELIKVVAKELKKPEDCIIIDKIFSEFGKSASRLKVQVYDKKENVPQKKTEKMKIRIEGPAKKEAKAAPTKPQAAETAKPTAGEGEKKG